MLPPLMSDNLVTGMYAGGCRWMQVGTGGRRWAQVDEYGQKLMKIFSVLQASLMPSFAFLVLSQQVLLSSTISYLPCKQRQLQRYPHMYLHRYPGSGIHTGFHTCICTGIHRLHRYPLHQGDIAHVLHLSNIAIVSHSESQIPLF